jgi:hypothetical protein
MTLTSTLTPDLTDLSVSELMALFGKLDAPSIEEMHGDYDARLLRQPSRIAEINGYLTVRSPLRPWRSKGFRPVDASSGRGYNSFTPRGKVIQRYPMDTRLAPSRYDGESAYTLIYAAFRSICGVINMVDEVRRVSDGLYLGIGTFGFTGAQRQIPLPFALARTERPYLGDIGTPRAGFRPGPREIPALAQPGPGAQSPAPAS